MERTTRSKIFGIGLSKTGTYSLTVALRYLGLSAIHYPTNMAQIKAHAAATDITVTANFVELDRLFPASKFILTERKLEDWLDSCRRHYLKRRSEPSAFVRQIRRRVFGTDVYDRDLFVESYRNHQAFVRDYFADRPADLLTFDLCRPSPDWRPLCKFLKKQPPVAPFPWGNKTAVTDALLVRTLDYLGDVGRVAGVTGVHPAYLESLTGGSEQPSLGLDAEVMEDDGGYHDEIVAKLVSYFGSVPVTAAKLKISTTVVENSLARVAREFNQRKKVG